MEYVDRTARCALSDLDRALVLRPGHPRLLFWRAHVHFRLRHALAAGRDLQAGLRVDPTDSKARWLFPHVVKGLIYSGFHKARAGKREEALQAYELAMNLDPSNREASLRHANLVAGKAPASAAEAKDAITKLERRARAAPNDFRVHQRLDYALARQRRFKRVIALWTAFIARNLQEGRAFLERGGAHYNLRQFARALADVKARDHRLELVGQTTRGSRGRRPRCWRAGSRRLRGRRCRCSTARCRRRRASR